MYVGIHLLTRFFGTISIVVVSSAPATEIKSCMLIVCPLKQPGQKLMELEKISSLNLVVFHKFHYQLSSSKFPEINEN